jgi:hypothetical protein
MELEAKFAEHLSAVWNVCTTSVFPLLPIAAATRIGMDELLEVNGEMTHID